MVLQLERNIFPCHKVEDDLKKVRCSHKIKCWGSRGWEKLGLRLNFMLDWFDLLAVQGPLKSLLQYHIWKASVIWRLASFMFQLSHPYMTTGKTITLIRWTFVGKGNTHMVFPSKIILWIAHLFITVTSNAINCHQLKVCVEDFPGGLVVGNPPTNAGDMGSIPGLWEFHLLGGN